MSSAYGRAPSQQDKARIFQALRIAVNQELSVLQQTLPRIRDALTPSGLLAVMSYHSLEDRLVKRAFAQGMREHRWTVLTKKVVRPSVLEVSENPRARSAKLRAVECR